MKRVAIFGFGLIGGSLALALREQIAGVQIVAIDVRAVIESELAQAISAEQVEVADTSALRRALASAELAVLATPVSSIIELLPDALAYAPLVTDCGSTKRAICARACAAEPHAHFVPGHPMAGRPQGGLSNARADLFLGQTWILCPERSSADAVDAVTGVVRALGARPLLMSAEQHDHAVALTSHVPQLLASILTVLGARDGADAAAGPAFASATRVAGGSEAMWADIFATNSDAIAHALESLRGELAAIIDGLERGDLKNGRALEVLAEARRLRSGNSR